MWWFLLVADLYFLSGGVRSMLEYGPDQYNIVIVGVGGRAWAEGSLFSLWNDIISKSPILPEYKLVALSVCR